MALRPRASIIALALVLGSVAPAAASDYQTRRSTIAQQLRWSEGYATFAFALGIYETGRWNTEDERNREDDQGDQSRGMLKSFPRLGAYLAGCAIVNSHLHVGGFYSFDVGEMELDLQTTEGDVGIGSAETFDSAAGITFRVGGKLSNRLGGGLAVDLGLVLFDSNRERRNTKVQAGAMVFPRLFLEVMLEGSPRVKAALFGSLGVAAGFAAGEVLRNEDEIKTLWGWIKPAFQLGLSIGV